MKKETTDSNYWINKNVIRNQFVNKDNINEMSELITNVSKKVFEIITQESKTWYAKTFTWTRRKYKNPAHILTKKKMPESWEWVEIHNRYLRDLSTPLINFHSEGFMWQIHPSGNIHAIVSTLISSILNQNPIAQEVSPVFTKMENQVVLFLAKMIWYDIRNSGWTITSWWTMANLTSMLVARNKLLEWVAEDWILGSLKKYNEKKETNYNDVVVLVWEDAHYSIEKLAWYSWIGSKNIVLIPTSHNWDISTDKLKEIIDDCEKKWKLISQIVITAGTTENWIVQDIKSVVEVAKTYWQNGRKINVHVDAAFGWGFLVNEEIREKYFQDINKADSVTIDWHKMMYTNYSCWWIIFKNKDDLHYLKQSAKYILDESSSDENHWVYTVEWSRSTQWIHQLWSTIFGFWKKWLEELVLNTIKLREYLETKLESNSNFEIISKGPLNALCFRLVDSNLGTFETNKLNKNVKGDQYFKWCHYLWSTTIDEKFCFKAIFMNINTTPETIDNMLTELISLKNNFMKNYNVSFSKSPIAFSNQKKIHSNNSFQWVINVA